ncbi:MAG: type II secretion system F family protein [Candidatus Woesearchaeota archaeon]
MKLLEDFGKALVPEKLFNIDVRVNLRKYLLKAGINKVPYSFFGMLFWITAIATYFIFMNFLYPLFIQGQNTFLVFIFSFLTWTFVQGTIVLTFILALYLNFNVKIFQRTHLIEKDLADFLVLVSTNMKGGLSLEQSLWSSIRPEFSLLAEEMTLVSKRVMTGDELGEALNEFAMKYQSPNLQRNLQLIIGEIKSGGKIVNVIDKVIQTLKKTKSLKDEMAAATISYIIFIGAIVIVISPALFALAFQLLNIILGFTSSLGGSLSSTSIGSGLQFDSEIDINNFKQFSIIALATISIGASMIISIIEKGDIRNGLKYIPVFAISSVVFYLIFMVVLSSLFGGMI